MPMQENDTNQQSIGMNGGNAEIDNVMHHLYGMSIESDDELYIDDEDGASDEDASQDESYFGGNAEPGTVSSDDDIISISDSPNQARLRRIISKPQVPHSVEELYNVWEKTAKDLLEGNTYPYSNFLHAFGDDTNEGTVSRRQEMTEIGKILFDFKSRGGKPGQPAMLKGREREGKTVALFSITLAALLLDMRVVILCAPN